MKWSVYERIMGTTFKGTWVNSGANPSQITSALIDRTGTVVASIAAISSLNGFYFSLHTLPNTPGPYVNEWRAWVNSYPYVDRQLVRSLNPLVD